MWKDEITVIINAGRLPWSVGSHDRYYTASTGRESLLARQISYPAPSMPAVTQGKAHGFIQRASHSSASLADGPAILFASYWLVRRLPARLITHPHTHPCSPGPSLPSLPAKLSHQVASHCNHTHEALQTGCSFLVNCSIEISRHAHLVFFDSVKCFVLLLILLSPSASNGVLSFTYYISCLRCSSDETKRGESKDLPDSHLPASTSKSSTSTCCAVPPAKFCNEMESKK